MTIGPVPTLLIVDDSATFREAARALLEAQAWTVVGEAPDGAAALRAVAELQPQVVLLDVVLPDANGFDVAETLAALPRPPQVLDLPHADHASVASDPAYAKAIAEFVDAP